jgi:cytochrome c-type biogenesis protein CcmH/NrfG
MIVFILLATLLTAIAVGLVLIPLIRPLRTQQAPAPWAALASCVLLAGGSAALYLHFSTWSWRLNPGVDSPESPIEQLIGELDAHPHDLAAWLKLGKSYVVLQEYPLAVRAFRHADQIAAGRSAPALIGEAEAMILIHDATLDGPAGQLIERALVLEPNSPKALFFGAAEAMRRGELAVARARFTKLLAMQPPPDVQLVLKREIAAIDAKMAAKKTRSAGKMTRSSSG